MASHVQYTQPPPPYTTAPPYHVPGQPPPIQMVPVSSVTVVPGVVTAYPVMGSQPQATVCPNCNSHIVTQLRPRPTTRTHLFAILLCLFGCWPCVCLPYCMDSCMNVDHHCPNCEAFMGSYIG